MRRSTLLLLVLSGLAGLAWAEPGDKHPAAKSAPIPASIPDNRRDPEERSDSASSGASSPAESLPGGPTDLGKEADKEEDAYRKKPQATKPRVRNLK